MAIYLPILRYDTYNCLNILLSIARCLRPSLTTKLARGFDSLVGDVKQTDMVTQLVCETTLPHPCVTSSDLFSSYFFKTILSLKEFQITLQACLCSLYLQCIYIQHTLPSLKGMSLQNLKPVCCDICTMQSISSPPSAFAFVNSPTFGPILSMRRP